MGAGQTSAAPKPEERAEKQESITSIDSNIKRVQTARKNAMGPIEHLRHLAIEIIENDPIRDAHCPVCGHDHGNFDGLRESIARSADEVTHSVRLFDAELEKLEHDRRSIQDEIFQQTELLAQAVEANKSLRQAETLISAFDLSLRELGINPEGTSLEYQIQLEVIKLRLILALRSLFDEMRTALALLDTSEVEVGSVNEIFSSVSPHLRNEAMRIREELRLVSTQSAEKSQLRVQYLTDLARRDVEKSWLEEFEQRDKWLFRLTAANVAAY